MNRYILTKTNYLLDTKKLSKHFSDIDFAPNGDVVGIENDQKVVIIERREIIKTSDNALELIQLGDYINYKGSLHHFMYFVPEGRDGFNIALCISGPNGRLNSVVVKQSDVKEVWKNPKGDKNTLTLAYKREYGKGASED